MPVPGSSIGASRGNLSQSTPLPIVSTSDFPRGSDERSAQSAFGGVAQSVEQRTFNPLVVGSSPTAFTDVSPVAA